MSATWLPWCIRQDGPPEKRGYSGVTTRGLEMIEGEVKHSTEGPLEAALGELFRPERSASWHFTIPKEGPPRQHYPLEAILWHCGLPGDRSFDTSLIGNITLLGEEHVDAPDNQLNANQLQNSIHISQDVRLLCPRVAANPPTLRVNEWEHGWLSATACPSGLIPWGPIFAGIIGGMEDDMAGTEELLTRIVKNLENINVKSDSLGNLDREMDVLLKETQAIKALIEAHAGSIPHTHT